MIQLDKKAQHEFFVLETANLTASRSRLFGTGWICDSYSYTDKGNQALHAQNGQSAPEISALFKLSANSSRVPVRNDCLSPTGMSNRLLFLSVCRPEDVASGAVFPGASNLSGSLLTFPRGGRGLEVQGGVQTPVHMVN